MRSFRRRVELQAVCGAAPSPVRVRGRGPSTYADFVIAVEDRWLTSA